LPELLRALPFFAPRAVGRFAPLRLFDPLLFFAPRAEGRREDDFFAPPRFALERFLPFFAEPRFALEPERLPRFDLALVAMCETSSEGGAGRIRNFRAQAPCVGRASQSDPYDHRNTHCRSSR
jgi:hypothetical protein